jgi:hypothetical protein
MFQSAQAFFQAALLGKSATPVICKGNPRSVRELFLSHSHQEACCFVHYQNRWKRDADTVAFVVLPLAPTASCIKTLLIDYPNARFHLLFGNELTGKILDCKVMLWLRYQDALFTLKNAQVDIQMPDKYLVIPEQAFSLSQFKKQTGLRARVRTHKPERNYTSFCEQYRTQILKAFNPLSHDPGAV